MLFFFLWLLTGQPTAIDEFRAIRAFRCEFTDGAGRTYSPGGETSSHTPERLAVLVTHSINYLRRTALASTEGTAGATAVTLTAGDRSTSFLMVSVDGNPMLKTIFASPRKAGPDDTQRYFAVLSRHVSLTNGDTRTDQLYGTCEASGK